jgi:hypothetical protein
VRDEQISVHQPNIGLDAGESRIKGVQQRTRMQVVVVRVGAGERNGGARRRGRESGGEEHECCSRGAGGNARNGTVHVAILGRAGFALPPGNSPSIPVNGREA